MKIKIKPKLTPAAAFGGYLLLVFIVFLSLALSSYAQVDTVWYRPHYGSGTPLTKPNDKTYKNTYIDTVSGQGYVYDGKLKIWNQAKISTGMRGETGAAGSNGTNGTSATVNVGTTTTLPAGSNATVTNSGSSSNAIFNFGIPQGVKGDNGSGTGGSGVPGILSPDDFKAKHTAQLISSADLAFFASVGATTNDTYDWAAWQMCMNQCDMKAIAKYGTYYWSRNVIKPALAKCTWIGGYCVIIATHNFSGALLTTVMPADFSSAEARCGAGANFVFSNVRFEGYSNQIAFQPFATSDNNLSNVTTAGFGTGLLLQFCLGGIYDNITCLNGSKGLILSWGGYPNDTPISSRFPTCNGSKIRNYHAVSISNIGIANYGAYDVEMDIKAIEGNGTINRAIDIDDMGNTGCKNFYIRSGDFEGITISPGAGNAYLHLKTVVGDSRTSITGTLMHTAGKFIWAEGANNPVIIVDRVNWIVTQQCLVSQGYTWQFDYCSAFPFPAAINSRFSPEGVLGTACNPNAAGEPPYNAQGCGANHYNYTTQGK